MNKILIITTLILCFANFASAQKKADTVVIKVGEASKIIFAIQDKKDLETLKQYNFQSLMNDMIAKLDKRDSTQLETAASTYLKDTVTTTITSDNQVQSVNEWPTEEDRKRYRENRRERDYDYFSYRSSNRSNRRTRSSFNIDLGTNNFLENGKFPADANSVYTVRPWGSWYVGLNSIQRTRIFNKLFLEWGGGVSWYNFKFQNDKTLLTKDDAQATFSYDTREFDFKKSKLTVVYVNFSLVPVIDFGANDQKPGLFSGRSSRSFRIGLGPYVGYRIDSYTKQVYKDLNGDEKVERHHDPFYLNNIRYGARLQFGFTGTDIFFNYDLNDLFVKGRAPQLNAFTFGITL